VQHGVAQKDRADEKAHHHPYRHDSSAQVVTGCEHCQSPEHEGDQADHRARRAHGTERADDVSWRYQNQEDDIDLDDLDRAAAITTTT